MYKIYKITNKRRSSEVYVGCTKQALKKRFQGHIRHKGSSVYPYIQKYGKENFEVTIIDYAENKKEAIEKEEFWTLFLKEQGYFLYNKYVGNKISEEVKQEKSIKMKERMKDKTKNPMYGKHFYGKDNHRSKQVRCIENNKIYESCTAAAKDLNCSISNIVNVCKGKLKYTKGLHFEYI